MSDWKKVGEGIWARGYELNGNPLITSAVALGEGELMIVNPATEMGDADFVATDELGTVTAIVSPGAYHNMGLPSWSARYPDAGLYGPGPAAAHIAKVHPKLAPLKDLEALSEQLPEGVTAEDWGGMGQPDAMIIVRRDDGTTWFTNEVITNWKGWPKSFMFKLIFKLTGSGPGLNINTMSLMFTKGKKPAVKAYILETLDAAPLTRLVPCHGDVLEDPDLATKLREVVERRL